MTRSFYLLYAFLLFTACGLQAQHIYLFAPPLSNSINTPGHSNEILITSVQGAFTRSVTQSAGMSRRFGPAVATEYTMTKRFDRASLRLMQAAIDGRPASTPYELRYYFDDVLAYKIEMGDPVITSFSTSSAEGVDSCPACPEVDETFTINFTRIRVTDYVSNPDIVIRWNFEDNRDTF